MASTYVLRPLVRLAGMSYNFGGGRKPESDRIPEAENYSEEEVNEYEGFEDTKYNAINEIIRLVCIDQYSGFIYRRCSENTGWSRNGYRRKGGGAIEDT